MKHGVIILLTYMLIPGFGCAQIKVSVEPEFGVNSVWPTRQVHGQETISSTPALLGGVNVTTYGGRRLFLSLGIQYSGTGRENVSRRKNIRDDGTTVASTRQSEITFTKFSIPVSLGYSFDLKNVTINPGIGARAVRYVNGRYTFVRRTHENGVLISERRANLNPYDPVSMSSTAREENFEAFIFTEIAFHNRWSVVIAFSAPRYSIHFVENKPPSSWDDSSAEHDYYKADLSIAVRYFVKGRRRLEKSTNSVK